MQPRNQKIMAAVMEEHGGLDSYLLSMSSNGRSSQKDTWGDELILEAAACLYKRHITVLSDIATVSPTNFNGGQSGHNGGQPLVIGFVNGNQGHSPAESSDTGSMTQFQLRPAVCRIHRGKFFVIKEGVRWY